eukprot:1138135-Pelagomonas_calceolata.AAC.2
MVALTLQRHYWICAPAGQAHTEDSQSFALTVHLAGVPIVLYLRWFGSAAHASQFCFRRSVLAHLNIRLRKKLRKLMAGTLCAKSSSQ